MASNYKELIRRAEEQLKITDNLLEKIRQKELDSSIRIDENADFVLTKISKINALMEYKEQERQVLEVQIKIHTLIHNILTSELGRLDLEVEKINYIIGGIEKDV